MEYADTHTHTKIYTKKYLQMIKIATRMAVLEGKCVSVFCMWHTPCRSCEGIRFKACSGRMPVGIWGLARTPRNSPDFSILERSRSMWVHLTRFRDALFSFALQTLTCSCLPPNKKSSPYQLFPDEALWFSVCNFQRRHSKENFLW